ncbi:DUF421 domain-containing protein [Halobacillus mangrovi]|uniref:YetF C-terminal domain-containing protein n=1 Tax=Halobacillus mangrovi TaxID=402384 RepID=A0A1W5ZV01_9BACI|nr:YetF domain-containing protein [Halobacillus mangrovi]ARI77134.1 hypothetical protein HM131_09910 [Halobacillus mangrovi]
MNYELVYRLILLVVILYIVFVVFQMKVSPAKHFRLRNIFNSEPIIVMTNGRILEKELRKVRYNVDELISQLRKKDVFHLSEVESAILETDGSLSVLKKTDLSHYSFRNSLKGKAAREHPQIVVIEGNILDFSLKVIGKDKRWLTRTLRKNGIENLSNIMVAQVDPLGNFYIDTRTDLISFTSNE